MLSQSGYSKRIDVFYYTSPLWDLNKINVTVFLGQRRNTRSCCERKCSCNANKINNTHMKVFDAKRYGDSIEVLSSLSGLYNYVRARRAGE